MKSIILLSVLILICFCIKVNVIAGNEPDCYIKAGDKLYFGTEIKMGLVHTRISLPDGTVAKVKNHDITAYRDHNSVYMLMPVICEDNDTLCMAMMKYITSRSGLSIFQYCCPQDDDVFFEYKDGRFYRKMDADFAKAELAYLGVHVK